MARMLSPICEKAIKVVGSCITSDHYITAIHWLNLALKLPLLLPTERARIDIQLARAWELWLKAFCEETPAS